MTQQEVNEGRCLCGSITWELSGETYAIHNCHCKMCQKVHGAAFGTYIFVKPDQFRWTSETNDLVHFESSEFLVRSSCDVCGAVVPYPGKNGDHWVAPAGGHDDGRRADCNIFTVDSAPWHEQDRSLPCHDAYPVEAGLPSVADLALPPKPEGAVRGSCQCGAVRFHVTEPFKVAYNCHCWRCRHGRAAAHASNGFVSFDGVQFLSGEKHLKSYKVPEARFFTQVFCEICSSLMPRRDPERMVAVIPLGSLDDDPGIRPVDHIFTDSMAGWHEITDDFPRHPEGPPA